ncbi:SusC/RagA family TonB-linked outer membrane protein [Chitinophaga lutea]
MKRSLLLFLFLLGIAGQSAYAQALITGKVISRQDGALLPGVTVRIKGTSTGTATKLDGAYSIQASQGQTLVFSFVGYLPREVQVGATNVINVDLNVDESKLKEFVYTGYGIKRDKKFLPYAVQEIKGEDVAGTQRENFINSLAGRVAGAQITSTSGTPGASASIILRGPVSMDGNNQPLFVVDGLPVSNRTFHQSALTSDGPNRDNDYTNRIADLNPEDIESITILKGPEATAMYGTDGASGAIVITTRRAKAGRGSVNYNNSFRAEKVYRFPEIQKVYGRGANGAEDTDIRQFFGPKYAEGTKMYDNINQFLNTGFTQKHNISMEAGSEKLTYRLSGALTDQQGVIPNSKFTRGSVNLSATAQITPRLNSNVSLTYIKTNNRKPSKGQNGYLFSLLSWPSDDDISDYLNPDGTRRKIRGDAGTESDNPYWDVERNLNQDRTDRTMANVSLTYEVAKWFNLTGRVGTDYYTTDGNVFLHPESNQGISPKGRIENYKETSSMFNGVFLATFDKTWGKFANNLILGMNFEDSRYNVISEKGEKFYDPNFNGMNNTDPATRLMKTTMSNKRKYGYFGTLNITYDNFWNVGITARQDASSTLVPNKPDFFYPGVSTSLILSELPAFKSLTDVSLFKLRASYAYTGKDPRVPYLTRSRLAQQATTGGGFALGVTGGNPDLKAEFTKSFEVGADLKFFKNRLGVDVAYYQLKSENQVLAPRLSYATGVVLKNINAGFLSNKGIELMITGGIIRKKDFSWDVTVNFDKNVNRISQMPADLPEFYVSDNWLYNIRTNYYQGVSLTTLGGYTYLRNNAGDILVDPANGQPLKNATFTPIADLNPDFKIGVINKLKYKDFYLTFNIDIRRGGDVFNGNEMYMYVNGLSTKTVDREQPRVVKGVLRDGKENSSKPTMNTIAVVPYYQNGYYISGAVEEEFVEKDVNWLRLRDVTLSYALPRTLLKRQRLFQNLSVFVTATDLFILTNYTGADPAVSALTAAAGGSGSGGYDYGALATPRGINFGLNAKF